MSKSMNVLWKLMDGGVTLSETQLNRRSLQCFNGSDAVDCIVAIDGSDINREAAARMCQEFCASGLFDTVNQDEFQDDNNAFYAFSSKAKGLNQLMKLGQQEQEEEEEEEKVSTSQIISRPVDRFFVDQIVDSFCAGVVLADRKWRLKIYPNCFIGSEAVSFLCTSQNLRRGEAVKVGQQLMDIGVFYHVTHDHHFCDERLFYRLTGSGTQRMESVSSKQSPPSVASGSAISSKLVSATQVREVAELFQRQVPLADRRYRLKIYEKCFVGSDAVDCLSRNQDLSRADAVAFGQALLKDGLFAHVCGDHDFKDEYLFYRFQADAPLFGNHSLARRFLSNVRKRDKNHSFRSGQGTPTHTGAVKLDSVSSLGFPSNGTLSMTPNKKDLVTTLKQRVRIADRKYRLRVYPNCFIGNEAVDCLCTLLKISREEAVELGQAMLQEGVFSHVCDGHDFEDEHKFYRFAEDQPAVRIGRIGQMLRSKSKPLSPHLHFKSKFLKKSAAARTAKADVSGDQADVNLVLAPQTGQMLGKSSVQVILEEDDISIQVGDNSSDISSITEPNDKSVLGANPSILKQSGGGQIQTDFGDSGIVADSNTFDSNDAAASAPEKAIVSNTTNVRASGDDIHSSPSSPMPTKGGKHPGTSPQGVASLGSAAVPETQSMASMCGTSMSRVTEVSNSSPKGAEPMLKAIKGEAGGCTDKSQDKRQQQQQQQQQRGTHSTNEDTNPANEGTSTDAPSTVVESALVDMQQKMEKLLREQHEFKSQIQNLNSTLIEISEENDALRNKQQELEGQLAGGNK